MSEARGVPLAGRLFDAAALSALTIAAVVVLRVAVPAPALPLAPGAGPAVPRSLDVAFPVHGPAAFAWLVVVFALVTAINFALALFGASIIREED